MSARAIAMLVAGALGLALTGSADAQRLGRLFSTPEQRLALEEARREHELGAPVVEAPTAEERTERPDPVVSQLTINGMVLRSSGVNATWINGSPVLGGMTREGLRVEAEAGDAGGGVRITLPSGVETVQLRPGQKIDVISGAVLEVYERDQDEEAQSAFDPAAGGEEALDAGPPVAPAGPAPPAGS